MILPLKGAEYVSKVAENSVTYMKSVGIYGKAEAEAIDKFIKIFNPHNFPIGSSVFFLQSPNGTLKVSYLFYLIKWLHFMIKKMVALL